MVMVYRFMANLKNFWIFAIEQNINVISKQGKFTTIVYQKLICAYIHFDSFLTNTYRIGMVYKLVNTCFRI